MNFSMIKRLSSEVLHLHSSRLSGNRNRSLSRLWGRAPWATALATRLFASHCFRNLRQFCIFVSRSTTFLHHQKLEVYISQHRLTANGVWIETQNGLLSPFRMFADAQSQLFVQLTATNLAINYFTFAHLKVLVKSLLLFWMTLILYQIIICLKRHQALQNQLLGAQNLEIFWGATAPFAPPWLRLWTLGFLSCNIM